MLKHKSYFVYALQNPKSGRIFYIGKAQHGKETSTFWRHLHSKTNRWKNNVVSSIVRDGLEPRFVILRSLLSEEKAFSLECKLIATLRLLGFHLTNLTNGGEGSSGLKHSASECARRSERMRNSNPMKNPIAAKKVSIARSKQVFQFKGDCLMATYNSAREAESKTGVFQQNITACCRRETEQASGYVWRYSNDS